MIHPTAIVHSGAKLAADVEIGPYVLIGEHVEIASGTFIGSHTVLTGHTRIGRSNRIFQHCVLGGAPQDKKYAGEPTRLEIGDGNMIREFCTFNTGTVQDVGVTRMGNNNWVMAYVHLAHDVQIGSNTTLANSAQFAGHVIVEDYAVVGGVTGVHQFCRIGAHAMVGAASLVLADVPPYVMAIGNNCEPRGINAEGLKRRGFDPARIASIKRAYRTLFVSGKPMAEARQELAGTAQESADVQQMLEFIERSERGLLR